MSSPNLSGVTHALLLEGVHSDAVALLEAAGVSVELVGGALDSGELSDRLAGVHLLGIRSKT